MKTHIVDESISCVDPYGSPYQENLLYPVVSINAIDMGEGSPPLKLRSRFSAPFVFSGTSIPQITSSVATMKPLGEALLPLDTHAGLAVHLLQCMSMAAKVHCNPFLEVAQSEPLAFHLSPTDMNGILQEIVEVTEQFEESLVEAKVEPKVIATCFQASFDILHVHFLQMQRQLSASQLEVAFSSDTRDRVYGFLDKTIDHTNEVISQGAVSLLVSGVDVLFSGRAHEFVEGLFRSAVNSSAKLTKPRRQLLFKTLSNGDVGRLANFLLPSPSQTKKICELGFALIDHVDEEKSFLGFHLISALQCILWSRVPVVENTQQSNEKEQQYDESSGWQSALSEVIRSHLVAARAVKLKPPHDHHSIRLLPSLFLEMTQNDILLDPTVWRIVWDFLSIDVAKALKEEREKVEENLLLQNIAAAGMIFCIRSCTWGLSNHVIFEDLQTVLKLPICSSGLDRDLNWDAVSHFIDARENDALPSKLEALLPPEDTFEEGVKAFGRTLFLVVAKFERPDIYAEILSKNEDRREVSETTVSYFKNFCKAYVEAKPKSSDYTVEQLEARAQFLLHFQSPLEKLKQEEVSLQSVFCAAERDKERKGKEKEGEDDAKQDGEKFNGRLVREMAFFFAIKDTKNKLPPVGKRDQDGGGMRGLMRDILTKSLKNRIERIGIAMDQLKVIVGDLHQPIVHQFRSLLFETLAKALTDNGKVSFFQSLLGLASPKELARLYESLVPIVEGLLQLIKDAEEEKLSPLNIVHLLQCFYQCPMQLMQFDVFFVPTKLLPSLSTLAKSKDLNTSRFAFQVMLNNILQFCDGVSSDATLDKLDESTNSAKLYSLKLSLPSNLQDSALQGIVDMTYLWCPVIANEEKVNKERQRVLITFGVLVLSLLSGVPKAFQKESSNWFKLASDIALPSHRQVSKMTNVWSLVLQKLFNLNASWMMSTPKLMEEVGTKVVNWYKELVIRAEELSNKEAFLMKTLCETIRENLAKPHWKLLSQIAVIDAFESFKDVENETERNALVVATSILSPTVYSTPLRSNTHVEVHPKQPLEAIVLSADLKEKKVNALQATKPYRVLSVGTEQIAAHNVSTKTSSLNLPCEERASLQKLIYGALDIVAQSGEEWMDKHPVISAQLMSAFCSITNSKSPSSQSPIDSSVALNKSGSLKVSPQKVSLAMSDDVWAKRFKKLVNVACLQSELINLRDLETQFSLDRFIRPHQQESNPNGKKKQSEKRAKKPKPVEDRIKLVKKGMWLEVYAPFWTNAFFGCVVKDVRGNHIKVKLPQLYTDFRVFWAPLDSGIFFPIRSCADRFNKRCMHPDCYVTRERHLTSERVVNWSEFIEERHEFLSVPKEVFLPEFTTCTTPPPQPAKSVITLDSAYKPGQFEEQPLTANGLTVGGVSASLCKLPSGDPSSLCHELGFALPNSNTPIFQNDKSTLEGDDNGIIERLEKNRHMYMVGWARKMILCELEHNPTRSSNQLLLSGQLLEFVETMNYDEDRQALLDQIFVHLNKREKDDLLDSIEMRAPRWLLLPAQEPYCLIGETKHPLGEDSFTSTQNYSAHKLENSAALAPVQAYQVVFDKQCCDLFEGLALEFSWKETRRRFDEIHRLANFVVDAPSFQVTTSFSCPVSSAMWGIRWRAYPIYISPVKETPTTFPRFLRNALDLIKFGIRKRFDLNNEIGGISVAQRNLFQVLLQSALLLTGSMRNQLLRVADTFIDYMGRLYSKDKVAIKHIAKYLFGSKELNILLRKVDSPALKSISLQLLRFRSFPGVLEYLSETEAKATELVHNEQRTHSTWCALWDRESLSKRELKVLDLQANGSSKFIGQFSNNQFSLSSHSSEPCESLTASQIVDNDEDDEAYTNPYPLNDLLISIRREGETENFLDGSMLLNQSHDFVSPNKQSNNVCIVFEAASPLSISAVKFRQGSNENSAKSGAVYACACQPTLADIENIKKIENELRLDICENGDAVLAIDNSAKFIKIASFEFMEQESRSDEVVKVCETAPAQFFVVVLHSPWSSTATTLSLNSIEFYGFQHSLNFQDGDVLVLASYNEAGSSSRATIVDFGSNINNGWAVSALIRTPVGEVDINPENERVLATTSLGDTIWLSANGKQLGMYLDGGQRRVILSQNTHMSVPGKFYLLTMGGSRMGTFFVCVDGKFIVSQKRVGRVQGHLATIGNDSEGSRPIGQIAKLRIFNFLPTKFEVHNDISMGEFLRMPLESKGGAKMKAISGHGLYDEAKGIFTAPDPSSWDMGTFPTCRFGEGIPHSATGFYYYELRPLEMFGCCQLGWVTDNATATSTGGDGVGDDKWSWAWCGIRGTKWHRSQGHEYSSYAGGGLFFFFFFFFFFLFVCLFVCLFVLFCFVLFCFVLFCFVLFCFEYELSLSCSF